jgi:pimeloyl-ACP methyl ester carboxylesterase
MLVPIENAEIHVVEPQVQGLEEDPSLLFVHGAGGDASIWEEQAHHFQGRHLVYRLELPGHGQSSLSGEEEIGAYAEWVRRVIEKLFPSKPYLLVGHSMGGAIILQLVTDSLKGVHGIVLVGTRAKLSVARGAFQMFKENPDAFFQAIDLFAFAPETGGEVRERLITVTRRCSPSVMLKDLKACDRFDIRDRLGNIRLPTLIICGKDDQLTPVGYAKHLHEEITDSRLVIIPHAGHMVMAEQPESFNKVLESFIEEISV